MPPSAIATLLHISDLHFDGELTEKGRHHWKRSFGVSSHSFAKIDALSAKAAALECLGLEPDILLATGDISTDGSVESFKAALEFLENEDIYRGTPGRLVTKGLGMKRWQRVVLPGNHDRYSNSFLPYQHPTDAFEEVFGLFGTETKYPYVVGYRRPEVRDDEDELALLFFVFDSTAPHDLAKSAAPWVRIARGRIEDAEARWLIEQYARIKESGEVLGLDGRPLPVDYDKAVRIAVLHHHPMLDLNMPQMFKGWTVMENSEKFVNACSAAGIHLVLFGHQHEFYRWVYRGTHFVCCPSTSQFSDTTNGFFHIDFNRDDFTVRRYMWNGYSFADIAPKTDPYERSFGSAQKSAVGGS